MKLNKSLLVLALMLCGCSGGNNVNGAVDYDPNKEATNDQFNFDGNYTPPELKVDGLKDDKEWESASTSLSFGAQNQCSVVLYRGENSLFCYFDVIDNDIFDNCYKIIKIETTEDDIIIKLEDK